MTLKLSGSPIFLMFFFRQSGAISRLHGQWCLLVAGTWLLRTSTCFWGHHFISAAVTMASSFSTIVKVVTRRRSDTGTPRRVLLEVFLLGAHEPQLAGGRGQDTAEL
jgi:hypothetical protein